MATNGKARWESNSKGVVRGDHSYVERSVCAASSIVNWIEGVVQSQRVGLVRAGARINLGERVHLRVRWPIGDGRRFITGQRVIATIPAEAVRLEAGLFRRSKQRWNRWPGRIVLVEPYRDAQVTTVKVHGENWSLKSTAPIGGSDHRAQTWDPVNIVIDPQTIELGALRDETQIQPDSCEVRSGPTPDPGQIWLRGCVKKMQRCPMGVQLLLQIGQAQVSALICCGEQSLAQWIPGAPIEVHVGRYESWLRSVESREKKGASIECKLVFQ
jgi:hypothetical protein